MAWQVISPDGNIYTFKKKFTAKIAIHMAMYSMVHYLEGRQFEGVKTSVIRTPDGGAEHRVHWSEKTMKWKLIEVSND